MEDIKSSYEMLSYQINPKVLKGLKRLDLNMDELLLLIYLTNVKTVLDLNDITNRTSLNEEEIFGAYSSLLSKGLIEVNMEKVNGKISESIKVDGLYNKLALKEEKKEINKTDIYSKFESEFARSLSPIEYETINKWLENGVKEELIESALKEAVVSGVCNLRYIDKIIYDWTKKNKNNIDEEKEEYVPLYDFDWLGENND